MILSGWKRSATPAAREAADYLHRHIRAPVNSGSATGADDLVCLFTMSLFYLTFGPTASRSRDKPRHREWHARSQRGNSAADDHVGIEDCTDHGMARLD